MRGPSFYPAEAAYEATQQEYDDAVKYDRPAYKINDARQKMLDAKKHLDMVERTGE